LKENMMKRLTLAVAALLFLAGVGHSELQYIVVSATATSQTININQHMMTLVNDGANEVYIRVFTAGESPAASTTTKAQVKSGESFDFADQLGRLRYGVPTSEKERLALSGSLPGSPSAATEDASEAERYASGYLFAREHPVLQALVQPTVDAARIGWFGDSPELQSYATAGANAGRGSNKVNTQTIETLLGLMAGGR
jgi:hypothetical protein